MEPCRACRPVVADMHHFDEKQDPNPHRNQKSDQDPDTHQSRIRIRLNLKIKIPFLQNNIPLKSLYLDIMSNTTHLQGRNTKLKFMSRILEKYI
jgi:hypothetical protein